MGIQLNKRTLATKARPQLRKSSTGFVFIKMKLSQKDFIKISQKTNGRCFYCNNNGEVVDHFTSKKKWQEWELEETPIRGQLNNLENLFLACKKCNSSKKDKCPEDFIGNSHRIWIRYYRANNRIGLLYNRSEIERLKKGESW